MDAALVGVGNVERGAAVGGVGDEVGGVVGGELDVTPPLVVLAVRPLPCQVLPSRLALMPPLVVLTLTLPPRLSMCRPPLVVSP